MKVIFSLILLLSLQNIAYAESCAIKDRSFESFFKRYISDSEFQRKRTILPLVSREGDGSSQPPEVKLLNSDDLNKLTYPLILGDKQRKEDKVDRRFEKISKKYIEVFDYIDNADSYKVLYSFRNIYGCWYLEEIHDWSE